MIGTKQLIQSNVNGDCLRACICSILEMTNSDKYANIDWPMWHQWWDNFLFVMGLEMIYQQHPLWIDGYWIASVKSKNYEGGTHAVVMQHTKVAFDPSTAKRYRKGTNLLGTDLVVAGYNFFLSDIHKLYEHAPPTDISM